MPTPPNGHLGSEPIFQEGDIVYYEATPHWKTDRGMWHEIEGVSGVVQGVEPAALFYRGHQDNHPYKYPVLFEGHTRPLTPAAENIHCLLSKQHGWEV